jgi:GT2 family glycosyltransferase
VKAEWSYFSPLRRDSPAEGRGNAVNEDSLNREAVSVSIIIVSWNTKELLRRCLATIRAQEGPAFLDPIETIVVDNCSSDNTVEMLRDSFPEVKLIENRENVGFARATNQGTRCVRGDYILYLNPDTELKDGALSALVEFMRNIPSAGAVGARLVDAGGHLQASAYPTLGLLREFWRLFHLDRLRPVAIYPLNTWNLQKAHRVDVAQGACLLLRRTALEQVGLLDEDYYMYTEEVDLCYRLSRAGWEIYWEPHAVVVHHGGQSTRQRKTEMFLRLYESKILFFRKHHGRMPTNAYKGLLAIASLPRLLMGPFGRILGIGEHERQKELAHNYLQLLRRLPTL